MSIKLLDRDTIEKITAGEVVERPVSVVKELVENSLDANATGITVEIREGGLDYIRVTDNGCGIESEEVKLAFQNHATSKIEDAQGLNNVMTMGFRGEALPSIAAVSKVSLTTKTAAAEGGVRVKVEGGAFKEITQAGCPDGTTVIVSELFYNVPVRRTFIKKASYEQSLVSELVQKLALGNPNVSFRFISGGKTLMQTYGDGNILHTALAVYGSDYASGLKEINETEGSFRINGYIGVGDQEAPTRARQCFYLNGRLINCRMLSQALEEVCRGRVTIGKYPSCALMINTSTANIDVNVHPNKLEVRFRDEASFRLTVQTLLERSFVSDTMSNAFFADKHEKAPEKSVTFSETVAPKPAETPKTEQNNFDFFRTFGTVTENEAEVHSSVRERPLGFEPKYTNPPVQLAFTAKSVPTEQSTVSDAGYRLIGVYLNTYIIIEYKESLIMIDQHAAHERLNYEKYTALLSEGTASQPLLVPIILNVNPHEQAVINDNITLLNEAGYQIEPFGEGSIKVSAVPFIYGESDLRMLFTEMLDSLDMLKRAEKTRKLDSVIQASCKHAVKGGEKLTQQEINSLLEQMRISNAPPTCPHGRPVMRVYSRSDIERLFKRIQ
ncbi:MAG: DNA mismatch repair endonuclease MutL [Clostridia bacterium]|nr:DNA mismatch repair endonuclease MutL [Clostridia bacterium]